MKDKDKEIIERERKKIIMEGRICPVCRPLPLIFYEKESNEKELIFKCCWCKMKIIAMISSQNVKWFFVRKNQVLLESFT